MRVAPRNRLTREERLARWNADAAQARALRPEPATGKNARWDWIHSLYGATGLSAVERLVGIVIALAGNADGSDIFPGIRLIAERTHLSERVVSKSISVLVQRGRLLRKFRKGGAGAGAGFEYVLMKPTVPTPDQRQVLTRD